MLALSTVWVNMSQSDVMYVFFYAPCNLAFATDQNPVIRPMSLHRLVYDETVEFLPHQRTLTGTLDSQDPQV